MLLRASLLTGCDVGLWAHSACDSKQTGDIPVLQLAFLALLYTQGVTGCCAFAGSPDQTPEARLAAPSTAQEVRGISCV